MNPSRVAIRFSLLLGLSGFASQVLCFAQDFTPLTEEMGTLVSKQYSAYRNNVELLESLGFQADVVNDIEVTDPNILEPIRVRKYGLIAGWVNEKFYRVDCVDWKISDDRYKWSDGERLIVNEHGAFLQRDPDYLKRVEDVARNSRLKPFNPAALIFETHPTIDGTGASAASLETFETVARLATARKQDSKIEAIYEAPDHNRVGGLTYDTAFGGMPVRIQALLRDVKLEEEKPWQPIQPSEIKDLHTEATMRAYWTKVPYENGQELWVPEAFSYFEQTAERTERVTIYFLDWKVGDQVDMKLFDHKPFERPQLKLDAVPQPFLANTEVKHEYEDRQDEIDAKLHALRKKWKFE